MPITGEIDEHVVTAPGDSKKTKYYYHISNSIHSKTVFELENLKPIEVQNCSVLVVLPIPILLQGMYPIYHKLYKL